MGAGSSIQTAMQSLAFESFTDDGVLTATFDGVTLPHTDKELPDITLTDGRVRATL